MLDRDALATEVSRRIGWNMRPDVFDLIYRATFTCKRNEKVGMWMGQMYYKFRDMNADQLHSIASFMDRCNCNEDTRSFTFYFEGRTWMIGDGDDSLATSWVNGGLRIWVRSWDD